MKRVIALLLLTAVLGACSSRPPASAVTSAVPASATTNALAGTPLAVYGHDLDKAKNVQNIVNAEAQKQAKAIHAATASSTN